MIENIKREHLVIIEVNPSTREVTVRNHTGYHELDVDVSGDIGDTKDGEEALTITATIIFKKKKKDGK